LCHVTFAPFCISSIKYDFILNLFEDPLPWEGYVYCGSSARKLRTFWKQVSRQMLRSEVITVPIHFSHKLDSMRPEIINRVGSFNSLSARYGFATALMSLNITWGQFVCRNYRSQILAIDQLNALNLVFLISLLYAST
jgi:hypothetical protein